MEIFENLRRAGTAVRRAVASAIPSPVASAAKRAGTAVKRVSGPLFPIVAFIALELVLLSLSRLGLAIWQSDRVSAVGGRAQLFLQGVRVDFASLGWMLTIPAIASALLLAPNLPGKIWRFVLRVWLTAETLFFFFMELATPAFLAEYDFRPNRLFFEYLTSPREVFSMLVNGHAGALCAATVLTVAGAVAFWKFSGTVTRDLAFPRIWWRPIYGVVAAAVLIVGARSSFEHRPLNPSTVAFSNDAMVNSLAINSGYSVLFAATQLSSESKASQIYGKMPLSEVIARVKKLRGRPESDYTPETDNPTNTLNRASTRRERPKNVVIVLLESQGAEFVGSLGGKPLSPNFDALSQRGWFFERCFATGTRSVRGIEAVITGFPPTPARSVVKLGKSQSGFFTIADLFRDRGFHTAFIYGGEKQFDNMASFFYGNDFEEIIDEDNYDEPEFVGSWGVCDEDLFNEAHKKFSEWDAAGTPFFALVFTSSNHDPYEFPDDCIELFDAEKQTRNNAAKYADFALGKFFADAAASDYWHDTVFLVVADHASRVRGASLVPLKNFHVPALFLGDCVPVAREPGIISQIDLAPTLLSLAGLDAEYPMLGFDLTREKPNRALMVYDKNFARLSGNRAVILQPNKPAQGFIFDFDKNTLTPTEISDEEARDTLAVALFGSYAYELELYTDDEVESDRAKRENTISAK